MTEPTSKTPAGRELDLLIAEKVLGLPVALLHTQQGGKHLMYGGQMTHVAECPRYSTDIAAAFEIVEKLGLSMVRHGTRWYVGQLSSSAYVRVWPEDTEPESSDGVININGSIEPCGVADDLPHAICLAALATLNADDARSKALGELARRDVADGSYDRAYTGEE